MSSLRPPAWSFGSRHERDIGGIEHVGGRCGVEGLSIRILVDNKDYAIIAPMVQIVDRCRPNHLIASTILSLQIVVRTIDIHAIFSWVVGVFKHIGLAIGDVFPQGQVGISNGLQNRLRV